MARNLYSDAGKSQKRKSPGLARRGIAREIRLRNTADMTASSHYVKGAAL